MTTYEGRPVVVGVDGSDSALHAVRWAASQAQEWRSPLRLTHAQESPWRYAATGAPVHPDYTAALRATADTWLAAATDQATDAAPGVQVETRVDITDPIALLAGESRDARLVVVGSRGLGGFSSLLAGSVAVGLAAHATCPVAIIRSQTAPRRNTSQPVVVGVDGTRGDDAVIEFAFDHAARRHAPLTAVHAWSDATTTRAARASLITRTWPDIEASERHALDERLARWRDKHPQVEVHPILTEARPAHSILDAAPDPQLIVVGSRGRGGLRGLLLGSVSQALIQHAPCPVVVVRQPRSRP